MTGSGLRNALSQLSGEIATQGAQAAFSSVDYFLNLMLDPFVSSRGGDVASDGAGANNYAGEDAKRTRTLQSASAGDREQDAYAAMAARLSRATTCSIRAGACGARPTAAN